MDIEALWYEAFPYFYGISGAVAFFIDPGSMLLKLSGVLLLSAAITIMRLRWVYRRTLFVELPTPSGIPANPGQESR